MADMTQETRDELLMAVAERVAWIPADRPHLVKAFERLQAALVTARRKIARPPEAR
jgi:hypothetical protein